jgi:iron complex outermembrane receptor protein
MDADFDDTDRFGFRWEAQNPTDSIMGIMVQAYYTLVNHWMTDRFRTSSAETSRGYSMGTMADTRTLGSKAELQLSDWTFGFEAYQRFWGAFTEMAKMNYKRQFSLPDVDMTGLGFYGEYLKPLSEKLTLITGARLDRISTEADESKANTGLYWAYHNTRLTSEVDTSPSGHARLDYGPYPGVHLALGVGTSVQVPEPSERFFALKRKGSDWVGNPLLRPSRNTGIDGTVSLEKEGALIETTLFHNWVDNFVTLYDQARLHDVPGVKNSQARTYANTNAHLWGTELNLVFPLQDRLFLSGDLSYIRGTKDPRIELGILSTNLAEIPPLRGRVNLRFDQGHFFAAIEGVYSAAQNRIDSDLSEETTPSYAILNVSGGIRRGKFGITAGIGNLFNRTFGEHLSYQRDPFRSGVRLTEPGRNLFLNLAVNL